MTEQILDKLVKFRNDATPATFADIFDSVGPHLWWNFANKYGFDVVVFYARLDNENRAKFIKAIGGDND